ncbi:aspartate aminotransferase family protein [Roseibacillus persicicus]|uniref:Acetylornithine aminotransferase n=1 Tax=Roseibacillus persicicus TaxID=454148 RepID=A0A918TFJ4_9BACT|nr:acetylornithine/succinylornithine family transaminase [Roseibacillus persicicus]MDQ8191497.1 acetylornithine/succinylornithine family transaminase [Roseibacillus persicicus]GHC42866.1 acetylornithine aminotransferase [Roseibacillus persicicus]
MSTSFDPTTAPILATYARFPLTLVKGEGSRVWDNQGNSYLDFCAGIAVCSLGHCHPSMVAAIEKQARTLIHVSNLYFTEPAAHLAQLITDLVEIPGKTFFANSGAEANDGLIKLARRFGRHCPNPETAEARHEIITFNKSFHGRTLGGIAATGQQKIKDGFDPLLPGFRHVPFNQLNALSEAITPETCAILLEPIQGEGGVNTATPEFLEGLAKLCKEHNLLLMLDEVQCGFGRLGEMMGWRALGAPDLQPDAISWAKGMGGGIPIGAFWVNDRPASDDGTALSSLLGPGSHGSTYGGNPLAAETSLAVLNEIADAELPANAMAREAQIRETIASWKHSAITAVRGKGLMLGIALNPEVVKAPEGKTIAAHLCGELLTNKLLVPPAGPDTIRFLPALNVTEAEVAEALSILKDTLDSL